MVRFIIIGLWVCVVALGSSYGAAYWAAGAAKAKSAEPYMPGLEYKRLPPITVPMIIDGKVKGYVLAKLVFTADATTLRQLPLDPAIFVVNDAFAEIYNNGRVDTGKLSKYNIKDMMDRIKVSTNTHLNGDVIQEVLVDSINYIDKTDMRAASGSNAPVKPAESTAPPKAAH
ncbi:hypothetical protein [Roseixanthobacter glucoisosaccharinicivorans]|uniref:hypothetical protein n=1 Tax=Roseixanthobacter glucoisosaccharinicivorans TaxID=3119923 RepID=UPI00372A72B4